MDLHALHRYLFADSLSALFVPMTAETEVARVDVVLELEQLESPLVLQITEVEFESAAGQTHDLVQLFAPYPIDVEPSELALLTAMLPSLNELTVLGAFNLNVAERLLYLRATVLAPRDEAGLSLVAEAVWLSYFNLDMVLPEVLSATSNSH